MLFTDQPQVIPRVFNTQIHIGDAVIGGHGIFVIVVAAVALGATFWLLERTRLGLAMRSLSQDETTARMYGVSVGWVTVATWGIASALGALSGVLVGSFIQVDHSIMTTILIQSFAALVLGGFGSTGARSRAVCCWASPRASWLDSARRHSRTPSCLPSSWSC